MARKPDPPETFEEVKDTNKWAKPPVDPAVGEVLNAVKGVSTHRLYMNCYLSKSTIQRLRAKTINRTKRPQHMTLVGVLNAAGLEYAIRRKK
jgi:hypothetical protein